MKTFERVIAEQQAEIDGMKTVIELQLKQMNGVFTKHYDLFQAFGELIDAKLPDRTNEEALKRYMTLRWKCRVIMAEAGFCCECRQFSCECDRG